MLPWFHGKTLEAGSRCSATECQSQGHLLSGEEVHTLGRWFNPQLMRLLPTDVDEQAGVRGARFNHDRAQMPMISVKYFNSSQTFKISSNLITVRVN